MPDSDDIDPKSYLADIKGPLPTPEQLATFKDQAIAFLRWVAPELCEPDVDIIRQALTFDKVEGVLAKYDDGTFLEFANGV